MPRSHTKPTKPAPKKGKPRAKQRPEGHSADQSTDTDTKPHKLSGLDAAAQVLVEAQTPLTTKEMVERMLAGGLWSTSGKTPAATLYSAIIREISAMGSKSRFRKEGPGRFAAAG